MPPRGRPGRRGAIDRVRQLCADEDPAEECAIVDETEDAVKQEPGPDCGAQTEQDPEAGHGQSSVSRSHGDNALEHSPSSGGVVDPSTKACSGCDALATHLTILDTVANQEHRSWGIKNFWGPFCGWCARMMKVRFAWMKNPAVVKWLSADERNKRQFRLCSIAYISLREENKIHVSAADIDARVELLVRHSHSLQEGHSFMHFIVATDFQVGQGTNPISGNCALVQLVVDGQMRLGFAVPSAQREHGIALPPNVIVGGTLVSDSKEDVQVVTELAAIALQSSKNLGFDPDAVQTPPSKQNRGGAASSVGAAGPRLAISSSALAAVLAAPSAAAGAAKLPWTRMRAS